ncbi:MAG: hypothetical protein JO021_16870, partial [Alphaproteobacteria bacterium]|nr:hypothetical protein [Alphaproteobacteria bacterium]
PTPTTAPIAPSSAQQAPTAPPVSNAPSTPPPEAPLPASPAPSGSAAAPPPDIPITAGAALLAQALARAGTAATTAATTATTPPPAGAAAPSPLAGLPAGERLLLRVVSIAPPSTLSSAPTAAPTPTSAAVPAAPAAVAPAAGATASATLATAAAATPISGAAQVQAASAPQAGQRPVVATPLNPTTLAPQAAPTASGPVAPGAILPIARGDGAAAFTAQPAPPTAAAVEAAAAATTAGATASTTAQTSASPVASTSTFSATVVGTSTTGQPILLAGQDLLTVRAAPIEPGSTLMLELAGRRPAMLAPGLPETQAATPLASVAELAAAAQATGGAAQAAISAVMPQPGPALAAQMAMFLSALQTGDLRAWIGEPARAALDRAGRTTTVSKVEGDLKRAAAAAREADAPDPANAAGTWRAQTIPFSNAGAIEPIRLFLHQTNPDDGNDAGKKAGGQPTRFLLDLDLSRLGRVQLDGFAQPPRFDLILRTETPLAEPTRLEILQLFANVTSARGLTGSLAFHVAPPIVPTETGRATPRPGIVV